MNVVLVSLARRGGMVHFLAELANALAPLTGTTVLISCFAERAYFSSRIRTICLNTGGPPLLQLVRLLNPFLWHGLLRQLISANPDVIHIAGVHEWNPMVAILCRIMGWPLVYTVHDPDAHPGAPLAIRVADRIVARMADEVIVLTRHGRSELMKRRHSESTITVIDHPMYSLFRRWRPRSDGAQHMLLYLGRIEAYKDLELLLRAFLGIRRSIPGWKLVIAGSGRMPARIRDATDPGVEILNRYLSDREVARLMHMASIVALPYTSATQSGVISLAQAFGRPVITSTVGGLREMVVDGRTGILVPPNDARALGNAIRLLARDPSRRARMRRHIAELGKRKWNPRDIAIAHQNTYARVLERGARS